MRSYWWEVASLLQRTVLTGWLLLLDVKLHFIRLVIALLVSISFLIALLACNPYKSWSDFGMAAGSQVMFVCMFIGGIIVRLFDDISTDTLGSFALAYRFLGLHTADGAVGAMIASTFGMIVILAATLYGESYMLVIQQRLEAKYTVVTMLPPHVQWKPTGIYACFLSHYKVEAASEARYANDLLRKMLKAPVFLDSSVLNDLRNLISDGIHKSDTVVVLATKRVLTRPWCLLELLEAKIKAIPVVIVQMAGGGFTFSDARDLVQNFEEKMKTRNPSGLEFLQAKLGRDLSELKEAVLHALDANEGSTLVFNSHANDSALLATMKDLVEKMAEVTNRKIEWSDAQRTSTRRSNSSTNLKKPAGDGADDENDPNQECAVMVCCSRQDALQHARVLRSELEAKIDRRCAVGGLPVSSSLIAQSDLVVALLTKQFVSDTSTLVEVWTALKKGVPVVTVMVAGGGYSYEEASAAYNNLATALDRMEEGASAKLQSKLPDGVTVAHVGEMIHSQLTAIIAILWSPNGTKNHLNAVLDDVLVRMQKKPKPLKRIFSFGRPLSLKSVVDMTKNEGTPEEVSSV